MSKLLIAGAAGLVLAGAAGLVLAGAAQAQIPAPVYKAPPAALANEAVRTAVETCKANGYHVAAVIVDVNDGFKAVLVSDGAPSTEAGYAQRKAATSLAYDKPSGAVGEQTKTDPFLAQKLKDDPKMLPWAGALPIDVNGQLMGAIGVGGAPGGEKDEACAKAALDKIAGRLAGG